MHNIIRLKINYNLLHINIQIQIVYDYSYIFNYLKSIINFVHTNKNHQ